MSVRMSAEDFEAQGYDFEASVAAGHAVKKPDAPKAKRGKAAKPCAPYKSKLELAYAAHLDWLVMLGRVKSWRYEPFTLICAGGTKYTPDFLVRLPDGTETLHETKGFFRPQDKVRMREAAVTTPLPIYMVVHEKGAWKVTPYRRPS